jgi:large subunit ribosomal protein L25
MKSIFMSGSPRENVGKKDAKALRIKGLVPCVLYGGAEQIHHPLQAQPPLGNMVEHEGHHGLHTR